MPKVKAKRGKTASKKAGKSSSPLTLPAAPSTPMQNIQDYVMLVYGREKVGKTTFAAQFPDTFFLMTERGAKAISVRERYAKDWKELLKYITLLEDNPGYCKTLVMDTVDNAIIYCTRAVCDRLCIDHPSDQDYGKGWTAVGDEFRAAMNRLEALGVGLIFISHEKEQVIERRKNGKNFTTIVPAAAMQARRVLEPMLDMWFYYGMNDDGQRGIHLRGSDLVYAGHRPMPCGRLDGYTFIPSQKTDKETYNAFMEAWNGTLKQGAASSTASRVRRKKAVNKVSAARRRTTKES